MVLKIGAQKYWHETIFGSKYKDFYFFNQLCVLTDLSVLISNMAIVISSFNLKIPHCILVNLRVLILIMTIANSSLDMICLK